MGLQTLEELDLSSKYDAETIKLQVFKDLKSLGCLQKYFKKNFMISTTCLVISLFEFNVAKANVYYFIF